jgi:hypothetical protein
MMIMLPPQHGDGGHQSVGAAASALSDPLLLSSGWGAARSRPEPFQAIYEWVRNYRKLWEG